MMRWFTTLGAMAKDSFRAKWIYLAIAAMVIIYMMVRTQISDNRAEEAWEISHAQSEQANISSQQTQECFNQLVSALNILVEVNVENDALASQERQAIQNLILDSAKIDPHATLEQRDAYGRELITRYYEVVNRTSAQRAANDAKRLDNPIPSPTCGRPPK